MKQSMNILVVNGSPKGEQSLTLQHSLYMLGQEKDVDYKVLQAGEASSKIDFEQGRKSYSCNRMVKILELVFV